MEEVILVDENDNQIGTEEKLKAHQGGKLHRAFSVFVFNSSCELMLQKRAGGKYHSRGLWTNTCCSHPRDGEETENAIHRRLKEEMDFDCDLKEVTEFIYKAKLNKDLTEHEYLHVYAGNYDNDPNPDPGEVSDWKWVSIEDLKKDIAKRPHRYTYWFKATLPKIRAYI